VLEEDPGAEGWDVAGLRVVRWGAKGMNYPKEVDSGSSAVSAERLGKGALDAQPLFDIQIGYGRQHDEGCHRR